VFRWRAGTQGIPFALPSSEFEGNVLYLIVFSEIRSLQENGSVPDLCEAQECLPDLPPRSHLQCVHYLFSLFVVLQSMASFF